MAVVKTDAATATNGAPAPVKKKRNVKPPSAKRVYVMVNDVSIKDKIVGVTLDPKEALAYMDEGKAVGYAKADVWVSRQKPQATPQTV